MRNSVIACMLLCMFISAHSQEQVKKGKWVISHSIGGIGYTKSSLKSYDNTGLLSGHNSSSRFGLNLIFRGPDWGELYALNSTSTNELNGQGVTGNSFTITVRPAAGIFIQNNLMIGASLFIRAGASNAESTYDTDGKSHDLGFGLGPLVRYYIGDKMKSKFFVGLESQFLYSNSKQEGNSISGTTSIKEVSKQNGGSIRINPVAGYTWFLGKRWGLELRLDYQFTSDDLKNTYHRYAGSSSSPSFSQKSKSKYTTHAIGINAGVSVYL